MSDKILTLSDDAFEADVLQSDTPVLVDFWAPWCGPCKMIGPILEAVSEDESFDGRLLIGKMNIDDNPNTPGKYGVRGIPTLLLFKGGSVAATKVGALSKTQLVDFLNDNL
ncbi:MAG: thioredoxin TrxA [Algicola sp.]|nr:thioredoxin TrxA [Algicola sp.]